MKGVTHALQCKETTLSDQQRDSVSSGPFGKSASAFIQAGMFPVPLGGDDGKSALMKWKNPSRKQAVFLSHQPKFAAANIGFITGPESGVTVIDIDKDDELLRIRAESHFGKTPLIVRTARGKWHLYYAYNGERRRTRHFGDDVAVDLLGDRGICVAPPSSTASGHYRFWRGSFADLSSLPKISAGALDAFEGHQATGFAYRSSSASMPKRSTSRSREHTGPTSTVKEAIRHAEQLPGLADGPVPEGRRNIACFKRGLRLARGIHENNGSLEDLVQQLLEWNRQNCTPPLHRQEVEKEAANCWKKTLSGGNWVGTGDPWYEMAKLARGGLCPDAITILAILKADQKHRPTFAVAPEGMETAKVIPGWNKRRYRRARKELEAAGLIVCAHRGGRGKGDPSLFRFGPKGAISAPNRNPHPSSVSSASFLQSPFLAKKAFFEVERDFVGDAVPALLDAVRFGAAVKRLRAERGWTVEQLAGMAGLVVPTFTIIEQGRFPTTLEQQQRILGCLQSAMQEVA